MKKKKKQRLSFFCHELPNVKNAFDSVNKKQLKKIHRYLKGKGTVSRWHIIDSVL